jgi:nitrogen regulatory protein PII
MHPVKRIEVLADSVELTKILAGLDKAGIIGHTVIRNVVGRSPGADATQLDNVYIIAFCMPEQVKPVIENIRPVLNKFGGACYISDAMEIRSVRCVSSL